MTPLGARLLGLVAASLLLGCPPASDKKPASREPCAKLGQTCEFSPGKLGSCVQRDDCTPSPGGTSCFVCQSQH
jgi:hypothetical protein